MIKQTMKQQTLLKLLLGLLVISLLLAGISLVTTTNVSAASVIPLRMCENNHCYYYGQFECAYQCCDVWCCLDPQGINCGAGQWYCESGWYCCSSCPY